METRKGRRRRASLRGWWKGIPFLLLWFGLMFLFTWLEKAYTANEYHLNELASEIDRMKDRVDKLRSQNYDLSRMDLMEEFAKELKMTVPSPSHIILVNIDDDTSSLSRLAKSENTNEDERRARSVVFVLDSAEHPSTDLATKVDELAKGPEQSLSTGVQEAL